MAIAPEKEGKRAVPRRFAVMGGRGDGACEPPTNPDIPAIGKTGLQEKRKKRGNAILLMGNLQKIRN